MPNDHAEMKRKIEDRYGEENVLWGDEVSDLGLVTATVAAYFGVPQGYEYFQDKLNGLKDFGLDAVAFLAKKGNPNSYILYFKNINIDHWETVKIGGFKKKIYFKRSYRYYLAVRKK